jgi:hypothetical protein
MSLAELPSWLSLAGALRRNSGMMDDASQEDIDL